MSFRSKKYKKNNALIAEAIAQNKQSDICDVSKAIELLQSFELSKYTETVELHVRLAINTTKSDQLVRSHVVLPHGTGKEVKIAVFVNPENEDVVSKLGVHAYGSDALIDQIKASGKVDFDIAIAEPDMMKKLPSIARILGTAGVMPNPKTGTVGTNFEEMIALIKAGKLDYRNDKSGNIHIPVGKVNFNATQLEENILAAIDSIEKAKPDVIKKKYILSAYVCTTMSPSIRIR